MLLKIVAVQLYPTVSPEHPGEYAPVHVSAYHGWFLSSQGGCRRRLGLDCWQVSYYNEIDHKMSPFHDHEIVFSPFSPLIKEGEINRERIVPKVKHLDSSYIIIKGLSYILYACKCNR